MAAARRGDSAIPVIPPFQGGTRSRSTSGPRGWPPNFARAAEMGAVSAQCGGSGIATRPSTRARGRAAPRARGDSHPTSQEPPRWAPLAHSAAARGSPLDPARGHEVAQHLGAAGVATQLRKNRHDGRRQRTVRRLGDRHSTRQAGTRSRSTSGPRGQPPSSPNSHPRGETPRCPGLRAKIPPGGSVTSGRNS